MSVEIASLSSGTQAGLFGLTRYDEIEAAVGNWIGWVIGQPWDKEWPTWQDCWEEYKTSSEYKTPDKTA